MTLVHTNVILDVADDAERANWSLRQLNAVAMRGQVLINAIAYAEFSIGYTHIEDVIVSLPAPDLTSLRFHTLGYFSQARCSSVIVLKAVVAAECCRIFSSARGLSADGTKLSFG